MNQLVEQPPEEQLIISTQVENGLSYRYVVDPSLPSTYSSIVDEQEIRRVCWRIRPGDIVLDLGCAVGSYTLPALAAGATHVVAVTPDPAETISLLRNLRVNGWETRCTVLSHGLYSKAGFLRVFPERPKEEFYEQRPESFEVDDGSCFAVDTVDAILSQWALPYVDAVKLDVEGCEAHVLLGMRQTLSRYRPRLLIEAHLFKDPTLQQQVEDLIYPLGYELCAQSTQRFVTNDGRLADVNLRHILYAQKQT